MTVTTIYGDMDDSMLEKTEGVSLDNEDEMSTFVEYRLNGELVHRSAHVTLKRIPFGMEGVVQALSA